MNFNFPHLYVEETESTNLLALDILSKTNPPNGFLIITDYQTAGKGQYGRKWQSERNKNLLFSLIIGPLNIPTNKLFRIHLASSLAIFRTLANEINNLNIKWPNDIYAGFKKLAGILVQNQLKGSMVDWTVIGIGINVNQTSFPDEIPATSAFIETGNIIHLENIVEKIRSQLMQIFSSSEAEWDLLWEEYNQHLFLKNQNVLIEVNNGDIISGKIISVTKEGKLTIETDSGQLLNFSFGEIQYQKIN